MPIVQYILLTVFCLSDSSDGPDSTGKVVDIQDWQNDTAVSEQCSLL